MSDTSLAVSPSPETNGTHIKTGETLTLQQLHQVLTSRGIQMGYSQLSEFFKTGDLADQLGAGGSGSRRAFEPEVAEILSEFLPQFRAAGGKLPQAPAMLRNFLRSRTGIEDGTLVASGAEMSPVTGAASEMSIVSEISEMPKQEGGAGQLGFATRLLSGILSPLTAALNRLAPITPALDRLAVLEALPGAMSDFAAAAREQRAVAPPAPALVEDRLLTAEQAAEMLACSPRSVSRYVTPVRPRTWRKSDCQRYIERLGEALEETKKEAVK